MDGFSLVKSPLWATWSCAEEDPVEGLIGLVAGERPDLVFVDVHLARGTRWVPAPKGQERFASPIVRPGHLTAADAEAAGLLGVLSKPYTADALRASRRCDCWLAGERFAKALYEAAGCRSMAPEGDKRSLPRRSSPLCR